jgi:hypothetical protein
MRSPHKIQPIQLDVLALAVLVVLVLVARKAVSALYGNPKAGRGEGRNQFPRNRTCGYTSQASEICEVFCFLELMLQWNLA